MKQRIVIFSGAGLSAESGLATFRNGEDGLWANYDINKICNYFTWQDNFKLVHEFYNQRRKELQSVKPNAAHYKIAEIQKKYGKDRVFVITQNIDNLLEQAGCENILHVHGESTKLICTECGNLFDIGYEPYNFEPCNSCNSTLIKPFVVFFYESAPMYRVMYERFDASHNDDIAIIIGTSGNIIDLSTLLKGNKSYKILNNLEKSDAIDEKLFNKIFYESATTAIDKIEELISKMVVFD